MFKKKWIALLLTLAMIFTASGFSTLTVAAATKSPVISISKTKLSLVEGKSKALKITISPKSQAKKAKITWKTSNKKIVIVSKKGTVKAVKAGSATITATVKLNGKTVKKVCKVTVVKAEKNLEIGSSNLTVKNETYDNIVIGSSVSNTTVTLEGVTVKGTLTLTDGASYKVVANDCDINNIVVASAVAAKADVTGLTKCPELVLNGKTKVSTVELSGTATLSGNTANMIKEVLVAANVAVDIKTAVMKLIVEDTAIQANVRIYNAIKEIVNNAFNTEFYLSVAAKVDTFTSNASKLKVTGEGTIAMAVINASDNDLKAKVEEVKTGTGVTGTVVNGNQVAADTTTKPGDTQTGGGAGGSTGGSTSTTATVTGVKADNTVTYTLPVSYKTLTQVVVEYKGKSYTVDSTVLSILKGALSSESTQLALWNGIKDQDYTKISGQKINIKGDVGSTKTVSFIGGALDGKSYTVTINADGSVVVNDFTITKSGENTLKITGSLQEAPTFKVTY